MPPAINRPKQFVSPLLHPSINRLFIARPALDYIPENNSRKSQQNADKPRLTGISADLAQKVPGYLAQQTASFMPARPVPHGAKAAARTDTLPEHVPFAGTSDPYRTVIVARLPRSISGHTLAKHFDRFGPVASVVVPPNATYGFVEYEQERDARAAYKEGDGMWVDGKRVLVDVERGRVVKGWKPRRLGGGLGATRRGGAKECFWERQAVQADLGEEKKNKSVIEKDVKAPDIKRQRIQYDDI